MKTVEPMDMHDIRVFNALRQQPQQFSRQAVRSPSCAGTAEFHAAVEPTLTRDRARFYSGADRHPMPMARHFTRHLEATYDRTSVSWINVRNYLYDVQELSACGRNGLEKLQT
jgi:hypothetical protein